MIGWIKSISPSHSPFAIVLSKGEDQSWITLLTQLRRQKAYRYTPVFYHGDVELKLRHLFDGPAEENMSEIASNIYQRIDAINGAMKESDDCESTLLSYLYSRLGVCLKGYIVDHSPYVYEYPLLNILFNKKQDFDQWLFLQDLVVRDLLAENMLIDEIQTCSSCDSGFLNLKNSCPSCYSIDIKPQKFVHCFSCGNIGPIPEFLRQERLICSQCHIKLHELGVDYEKPTEDKLCNSCGHFFSDSQMEIICLSCHKTSSPQELSSRRLYDYTLTKGAEYLVRGIEKSIYRNFNHFFKVIDYSTFMSIVSWQIRLAERYSPIYFSVITLNISNENELIDKKQEVNSERIMGQLFNHLRQVFRDSDLSSRLDGTMLFLLPMADEDGCLIILERIRETIKLLSKEEEGKNLTLCVTYMTSIEINNLGLRGASMLTELHAKLLESNACYIRAS